MGKSILLSPFAIFGRYILFLGQVFRKPAKFSIFLEDVAGQIWTLTVRSIYIVSVVSLFVGAAVTIEMAINLEHPMLPPFVIGAASRDVILLEFSSTIIALVLAGKVGGSIASEVGTMRITEQIDALNVMGINSAAFLILPKVVAMVLTFPLLASLSSLIAIAGGGFCVVASGFISAQDFIDGVRTFATPYYVWYSMLKMSVFAFLIATIPSFWGYYAKGGSLEVGLASTRGVVDSSIALLLANLLLTRMFLI